jgi:hypothetical protein
MWSSALGDQVTAEIDDKSDRSDSMTTTAEALKETLVSPNEHDRNLEAANVVDGLFAIARAIDGINLTGDLDDVAQALNRIAAALEKKQHDPGA